jgi:hypothetical protein
MISEVEGKKENATMQTIISSQRYLDSDTVDEKRDAEDYTVSLLAVGEIDGVEYSVVVDGHHSLAAAIEDGVTPNYQYVDGDIAREYQAELDSVGTDQWLINHYHDSDYYNVKTGVAIW